MKWVWNQEKDRALNLDRLTDIEIVKSAANEGSFYVLGTYNPELVGFRLATFPTRKEAREFIGNLTGAVGGNKE